LISGGPWFLGAFEQEQAGGQFKARVGNLDEGDIGAAYNALEDADKCEPKF